MNSLSGWQKTIRTPEILCQARLIAIRNTEEATRKAISRVKRKAAKNGRKQAKSETIELAKYFFVLTSLPTDYDPATVLSLYKMRWQIELAFKRLKSLFNIDKFNAKSIELSECHIITGLIFSILMDQEARDIIQNSKQKRKWSLWRLQQNLISNFKAAILGFINTDNFVRNISRIQQKLCEPSRLRTFQMNQQAELILR